MKLSTYQGRIQGGGGGRLTPSPPRKKSWSYLGVSVWTGGILMDKQRPICLRLQEKALENKKIIRGRPSHLTYIYYFVKF